MARVTRNTRWPSLGELWTFLGVALPALAALLVPMPAVDLTYQLRAGASMLAGEGLPGVDTWTFTIAGTPWLDQQWGAQILLAGTYQLAGWTGLAILRAGLVALTFGLVLTAIRHAWSLASVRHGGSAIASSSRTATLILLGSFVVAAPALALRPQLFAILLFAATLLILVQRAEHPRRLWLIPLIAIAWANLHGSFPLVVVLVALAWVDEVALIREPTPPGQPERRLPQRLLGSTGLALIGAIAAIATLVTPFGIDAWRYIENLARNPAITSEVTEWRPPSLFDPAGLVFYISLAIVIGVNAFRLRSDGRQRPPARLLTPIITVAVFAVLAVVTGRGLAWWALIAPVAMVKLQPGLRLQDVKLTGLPRLRARTAREASQTEARRSPLNALVVVVLFVAAIALLPVWRPLGPAGVPAAVVSEAPQGIAATLRSLLADGRLSPGARIWNPQLWGSWLEFAVPQAQFAVDSRIELFPPSLWSDVTQVDSGAADWPSTLAGYAVDIVVIRADQGRLEDALSGSSSWTKIYSDAEGSIWQPRLRSL